MIVYKIFMVLLLLILSSCATKKEENKLAIPPIAIEELSPVNTTQK